MSKSKGSDDDGIAEKTVDYNSLHRRRELRRQQRKTLKAIEEGTIGTGVEDECQIARDINNRLLKKVKHTRELKMDAEIFVARAKLVAKHVNAFIAPLQYDSHRFVKSLRAHFGNVDTNGKRILDWKSLGQNASVCYKSVPSNVVFLTNLMIASDEQTKPAKKKRRCCHRATDGEDIVEEPLEAKDFSGPNSSSEGIDAVSQQLKTMKKALKEQCQAARCAARSAITNEAAGSDGSEKQTLATHDDDEIDMIPFLVNPKSYTQTIENFMNFSMLIKQRVAGMRKGSDDLVYIRNVIQHEENGEGGEGRNDKRPYQYVLSLTMKDWRALNAAYNLTEGGLPHRTYEEGIKSNYQDNIASKI